MLTKVITGWNAAPGAPAAWDPARDGGCGALPIRYFPRNAKLDGSGPQIRWCESAWEPTPKELDMLSAGGSVVLRVWGWQPPVALYVEPPGGIAGEAERTLPPADVSPETYREIRQLLIRDGVVGTFDRRDGRETMELSGLRIAARKEAP